MTAASDHLEGAGPIAILEAALATFAGAAIPASLAWLLGVPRLLVIVVGTIGGLNGLVCGALKTYDWSKGKGWLAFALDSSWGLLGSMLALVVHAINLIGSAKYRADHSRRRNRHVYEHGFKLKRGYLVTIGNVISNAAGSGTTIEDRPERVRLIDEHEDLHVWQNRIFGVLMQATYAVWAAGGILYGFLFWLFSGRRNLASIILTTVYYDNPFEYWAYRRDRNWPPAGSDPRVRWPGSARSRT
jgi:hypothetical protein